MASLEMFLQMGGYAGFVWPAYGITLLVVVMLIVSNVTMLRRAEALLRVLRRASTAADRRRS